MHIIAKLTGIGKAVKKEIIHDTSKKSNKAGQPAKQFCDCIWQMHWGYMVLSLYSDLFLSVEMKKKVPSLNTNGRDRINIPGKIFDAAQIG